MCTAVRGDRRSVMPPRITHGSKPIQGALEELYQRVMVLQLASCRRDAAKRSQFGRPLTPIIGPSEEAEWPWPGSVT
jgi:hypothetical protein